MQSCQYYRTTTIITPFKSLPTFPQKIYGAADTAPPPSQGKGPGNEVAKIESLYGLGRQAKKLQGFVWTFATFARLPFEQFSAENSLTWLDSLSFSRISVKMFRFSIQSIQETRPSPLTFLQWAMSFP